MSDEEVMLYSKDQRLPLEGEPICIICGKYGEYVCDKTEQDVCSIECKNKLLETAKEKESKGNTPIFETTCDDSTFYQWRISAYYKYVTWSGLYSNKDIIEIRRGLNITIKGEFYHSLLSFDNLSLTDQLRSNLTEMGILSPTPVQMESIPCVLSNRDIIIRSNTGSGKTLSFILPLVLLQLDYYTTYQVFIDFIILILIPSRELAIQIEKVVQSLTHHITGIRTALIIGGESREQQLYRLRQNSNFIIATPGRLLDIIDHDNSLTGELIKRVRTVVIDEADQLMKSDFQDQINQILPSLTSSSLQKIIVSATVTTNLLSQIIPYLSQPIEILIDDIQKLNANLQYSIQWCEDTQKKKKLCKLLESCIQARQSFIHLPLLIICQTRLEVLEVMTLLDSTFNILSHKSITVETIFNQRRDIIQSFQKDEIQILVATPGIVGRGLELRAARSIILWSFSSSISEFIHNVGRIGRDGKEGSICVFCNAHNKKLFSGLVKLADEAKLKLPSQIKECIRETEMRSTKFSMKEIRNLNLFTEQSAESWKRFKSQCYVYYQIPEFGGSLVRQFLW